MFTRRSLICLLLPVATAATASPFLVAATSMVATLLAGVALVTTAGLAAIAWHSLSREEEARAEAQRMKTDILRGVSHELRTPLNAILGYAEILETMPELSLEEEDHMVARIFANAVTLTCAVNNLVEYAGVVTGESGLRRSTVPLGELLEELEPWVHRLIDEKPVTFAWTVGPGVPSLYLDRDKLRHVLLNLLANAARFTPAGEIRVSAAPATAGGRPGVEIEVSDTGIGMSASEQSRIFGELSHAPLAHDSGGIGLGLVLARCLSGVLGGSIAIESTPGLGTKVTISVPVAGTTAATTGPPDAIATARAGGESVAAAVGAESGGGRNDARYGFVMATHASTDRRLRSSGRQASDTGTFGSGTSIAKGKP